MDINKDKDFGLYFWLHMVWIVPAYLSPFLVSWKMILFGAVLLQVQHYVFGNCILTNLEYGKNKDYNFTWYYLQKRFPRINLHKTHYFVRVIAPIIIVLTGFSLQYLGGVKPIFNF